MHTSTSALILSICADDIVVVLAKVGFRCIDYPRRLVLNHGFGTPLVPSPPALPVLHSDNKMGLRKFSFLWKRDMLLCLIKLI